MCPAIWNPIIVIPQVEVCGDRGLTTARAGWESSREVTTTVSILKCQGTLSQSAVGIKQQRTKKWSECVSWCSQWRPPREFAIRRVRGLRAETWQETLVRWLTLPKLHLPVYKMGRCSSTPAHPALPPGPSVWWHLLFLCESQRPCL